MNYDIRMVNVETGGLAVFSAALPDAVFKGD
jgi:hypothetical protein